MNCSYKSSSIMTQLARNLYFFFSSVLAAAATASTPPHIINKRWEVEAFSSTMDQVPQAAPPPPAMNGTLSFDVQHRRHLIRGMWNYDTHNGVQSELPAQKFELSRNLAPNEEVEKLPQDGEFHGRFSLAYFHVTSKGQRKQRSKFIPESGVNIKFNPVVGKQNEYTIQGKGTNQFGVFHIEGTAKPSTAAGDPTLHLEFTKRYEPAEPKLKLDDVKLPPEALTVTDDGGSQLEPIKPPEQNAHSAVSRGILREKDDGSFICNGKWAVTREHFTNGQSSSFTVLLEAHFATEALAKNNSSGESSRTFPLDSDMYKGSFQLKKQGGGRYQTVIDQQVVMKFRKNSRGSFNVYGKGINAIGEFNLVGTLILIGRTAGQVELYRMYPPEKLNAPKPAPAPKSTDTPATTAGGAAGTVASGNRLLGPLPGPPTQQARRESTRLFKLPSMPKDDNPSVMLSRTMTICKQILRMIREKDVELGAFFSEPVDPVALGIPTYHQIIKEPMDLRTVHRRMESGSLDNPVEFVRLVRSVFEKAITFNVDPGHSVHQAARKLLVIFNHKIHDVELLIQKIKLAKGAEQKGNSKKKPQEDTGKRKRQQVEEEARHPKDVNAENPQETSSQAWDPNDPSSAPNGAVVLAFTYGDEKDSAHQHSELVHDRSSTFETVYRNAMRTMYKKGMIPKDLLKAIVTKEKVLKFKHRLWKELDADQVKTLKISTLLQSFDPTERPIEIMILIVDPPKEQNEVNDELENEIFGRL